MQMPTGRLAILSNIPTPYRLDFFDILHEELRSRNIDLHVGFCASTEAGRHWDLSGRATDYPVTVLPGFHPRFRRVTVHANPTVSRWVRGVDPDWLVTAGSWFMPSALVARNAMSRIGRPTLFWGEGHYNAVNHRSGPIASARRKVLSNFDGLVVPNDRSASFYAQETRDRLPILRLPNSVDEMFYRAPDVDKQVARSALGVREARTVVTVASLIPIKGVVESVSAYLSLDADTRNRLNLVVVGSGVLAARLHDMAASVEGVYLLGQQPAVSVRAAYWAADAFLLNSSYDSNPLTMIEAALCQLPLAATVAVGNSAELIADRNGWLLENNSPESVASVLERISDLDERALALMGERSARRAQGRFSRRSNARTFADALVRSFPV